MTNRILILLVIALLGFSDDKDKGREGNKRYHDKKYEEAAALFRQGLSSADESTEPAVRSGLANNLGCALNRMESYEEASAAFSDAIQLASSEKELTRSAYNAGNNAFQGQKPDRSLTYYRQALIADPTNEDARFNYEFVKRLMDSQQQESDSQQDPQQNPQDQQEQQDQQQPDQQEQQDEQPQDEQSGDNSQDEQQQQQEEEQPQPSEPKEQDAGMSEEQAEQILQALQNDEEELMRQVWRMKGKPRNVEKDW